VNSILQEDPRQSNKRRAVIMATEIGHASRVLWEQSAQAQIVEDVSHVVRVAPFLARYPTRLFTAGLASELAEAVDILACKVADLQEAEGADR
jgi:hypothetical protein